MKIIVIRHGETINNVLGLVQGRTDSDLTEKGINAAVQMKEMIKDMNIDYVISSPLKRAKETAKIVTDLPINIDDRLIERNWGLCEGTSIKEVDRIKCWNYNLNYQENAIESLNEFVSRIKEFLEELKKLKYKRILLVTHSAVSRVIYYLINGIPEDGDMSKIDIPNLKTMEYEI